MNHAHLPRLVLIALGACTSMPPALVPQVQAGPAQGVRPNRILVLQASCGSIEYRCPEEFRDTVDAIVRGGLEFAGYGVVESEQLRNQTRQRHEQHDSTSSISSSQAHSDVERDLLPFDQHVTTRQAHAQRSDTTTVTLDGPGFEDLAVDERHQVLVASGADAVVSVRIVVGGHTGLWLPGQDVEVMVKLGANQGDSMAWAARCMASSNQFSTVTAALENAARCAIRGATTR